MLIYADKWEGGFEEDVRARGVREPHAGPGQGGAPVFAAVQWLSCVRLWDPMDCSTPGFPVHHQLPELAQIHVHCIGDATQPSPALPPPSLFAFSLSQPPRKD